MRNQKFLATVYIAVLLAACGGVEQADEPLYTCPAQEQPEDCQSGPVVTIDINELVGIHSSDHIILSPEKRYLDFTFQFFNDGTYEVWEEGFLPLVDNCQGYSDGGWWLGEHGSFIVDGGTIILKPEFDTVLQQPIPDAEPYTLRVTEIKSDNGNLTLSGPKFCDLPFTKTDL